MDNEERKERKRNYNKFVWSARPELRKRQNERQRAWRRQKRLAKLNDSDRQELLKLFEQSDAIRLAGGTPKRVVFTPNDKRRKIIKRQRIKRDQDKNKRRLYQQTYRAEHRQKFNENCRMVQSSKRDYYRAYMREYWAENPLKFAAHKMRCRFRNFRIRNFWFDVPYSSEELETHLQACAANRGYPSTMMTIDHIIPLSAFFDFAGEKAKGWEGIMFDLSNIDYVPKAENTSKFNLISDAAIVTAQFLAFQHPQELTGFVDFLREKQAEQKKAGRHTEVKL